MNVLHALRIVLESIIKLKTPVDVYQDIKTKEVQFVCNLMSYVIKGAFNVIRLEIHYVWVAI